MTLPDIFFARRPAHSPSHLRVRRITIIKLNGAQVGEKRGLLQRGLGSTSSAGFVYLLCKRQCFGESMLQIQDPAQRILKTTYRRLVIRYEGKRVAERCSASSYSPCQGSA